MSPLRRVFPLETDAGRRPTCRAWRTSACTCPRSCSPSGRSPRSPCASASGPRSTQSLRRALGVRLGSLSRQQRDGRRARTRDALVVAQIAATLWLVVGASLLLRSFAELRQVNPGFNAERVYSLHLAIPRGKYPKDRDVAAFGNRILDRVRALPGVTFAGPGEPAAAGGRHADRRHSVPRAPIRKLDWIGNIDYRSVTPDYFRTLEIPLRGGRPLPAPIASPHRSSSIIDERLATRMLATPIRSAAAFAFRQAQPWLTIVGVVGHIRHDRVDEDARPQIYFPFEQRTQDRMALAVRTRTDPSAIGAALAGAIRSVDPEQPVYDARTLTPSSIARSGSAGCRRRCSARFACIAVVLASIGVYGVIAYAVGQRRAEFGIRLALGARRGEIVRGVLRRGVVLFAAGSASASSPPPPARECSAACCST